MASERPSATARARAGALLRVPTRGAGLLARRCRRAEGDCVGPVTGAGLRCRRLAFWCEHIEDPPPAHTWEDTPQGPGPCRRRECAGCGVGPPTSGGRLPRKMRPNTEGTMKARTLQFAFHFPHAHLHSARRPRLKESFFARKLGYMVYAPSLVQCRSCSAYNKSKGGCRATPTAFVARRRATRHRKILLTKRRQRKRPRTRPRASRRQRRRLRGHPEHPGAAKCVCAVRARAHATLQRSAVYATAAGTYHGPLTTPPQSCGVGIRKRRSERGRTAPQSSDSFRDMGTVRDGARLATRHAHGLVVIQPRSTAQSRSCALAALTGGSPCSPGSGTSTCLRRVTS
jgi:hypothetical protein